MEGIPIQCINVLIAISKGLNLDSIKSVIAVGQRVFGESYVQEAVEKIRNLQNFRMVLIGRIQMNKTKFIANNLSWGINIEKD